jgi:hypothetical protein
LHLSILSLIGKLLFKGKPIVCRCSLKFDFLTMSHSISFVALRPVKDESPSYYDTSSVQFAISAFDEVVQNVVRRFTRSPFPFTHRLRGDPMPVLSTCLVLALC